MQLYELVLNAKFVLSTRFFFLSPSEKVLGRFALRLQTFLMRLYIFIVRPFTYIKVAFARTKSANVIIRSAHPARASGSNNYYIQFNIPIIRSRLSSLSEIGSAFGVQNIIDWRATWTCNRPTFLLAESRDGGVKRQLVIGDK